MMGLEEKLLTVRLLCAIEFDIFLMWKDEAFARLLVEMTHFCVVYYGFSNPQNFCLFSILISYSQCYVLSFHLIIRSLSILLFHIRFLSSLFVLYFKFQSMFFFGLTADYSKLKFTKSFVQFSLVHFFSLSDWEFYFTCFSFIQCWLHYTKQKKILYHCVCLTNSKYLFAYFSVFFTKF